MTKPTRRLGRGLDSLISRYPDVDAAAVTTVQDARAPTPEGATDRPAAAAEQPASASVDDLHPNPFQPRRAVDENLEPLVASIRQSGVLQPIVVRRIGGRLEIIAGERRWAAAKAAGMRDVPIVLRQATDEQMLELALIENIQREDLNAIDRARGYRRFSNAFGLSAEQIAERTGEDRSTVTNYLRLLELPDDLQRLVAGGRLSMGHARCLLSVPDETRRRQLAVSAAANELSVRALEDIARRERKEHGPESAPPAVRRSAHVEDLQRRLERSTRTKVTIKEGKRKGTGRIILEFYSLDDFDRLAAMLGVVDE